MLYWLFLILVQALFIIHVFKTGRERYWIYILLFLPVAGGIAYFVVEILPDLLGNRNVRNAGRTITRMVNPGKELTELEERARRTPTVSNMTALANFYLDAGRRDEAIDLYHKCLVGPFSNDPEIILNLARAYSQSGNPQQAAETLEKLAGSPALDKPEALLLSARVQDKLGNREAASGFYRRAAEVGSGLEYSYWYAEYQLRTGNTVDAYEIFNDMVDAYKDMPSFSRKTNRQWIALVENAMKAR